MDSWGDGKASWNEEHGDLDCGSCDLRAPDTPACDQLSFMSSSLVICC